MRYVFDFYSPLDVYELVPSHYHITLDPAEDADIFFTLAEEKKYSTAAKLTFVFGESDGERVDSTNDLPKPIDAKYIAQIIEKGMQYAGNTN